MNRSIIISSVLHATLIFITALSLPFLAKKPINLPPNNTIFLGKKNAGKKINEIKIIPEKNNIENKWFLIICIKS